MAIIFGILLILVMGEFEELNVNIAMIDNTDTNIIKMIYIYLIVNSSAFYQIRLNFLLIIKRLVSKN